MRYAVSMLAVAVMDSFGDILLKYGLKHVQLSSVSSFSDIPHAALGAVSNLWLDLGVFLMIAQFVALIYAMRFGPLSLTVPLRGGSAYIGTTLLAYYFLGEQVTMVRWAAILLILTGVIMVGITGEKE